MDKKLQLPARPDLSAQTAKAQLRPPAMYKVLLLNDDFTPMDFVVGILEFFFGMNAQVAAQTMLQVHQAGSAICGVYTRDIAETKMFQVNEFARHHEYPLLCTMDKI